MAEPKEANFTRLVDATVEYRDNLSKRLDYLYPLITDEKSIQQLYSKKVDGEETGVNFASFHWTGEFTDLERKILTATLDLASKDPDRISYCKHAKLGHAQTFDKAINLFTKQLSDPNAKFTTEINAGVKETGRKLDLFRHEITTDWKKEEFVRPGPYYWALDIASSTKDRKSIEGKIRSAAIKESVPFAIMAGFYSGMLPKDIISVFEDQNFRKQLKYQDKKAHIPNILNNNYKDLKILNEIHEEIMDEGENGWYPVLNSQGYKTAIEIMKGVGWINEKDIKSLNFEKRELDIKSKVVLLSVPEVAMQVSDQRYKDPDKSKYIYQKYGSRVTTKVITAYLIFKQHLPKYSNITNNAD